MNSNANIFFEVRIFELRLTSLVVMSETEVHMGAALNTAYNAITASRM